MATNPLAQLRSSLTRDQQIVLCYKAGNTITEIAEAFQLTKQRVDQVLKKAGCSKQDNPKTRNQQLYAFVGANIPQELKDELTEAARRKKMSISAYIAKLIKDDLPGVV
jgi:predicted DNA-binding protein YlxM (UPF0122 family)